MWKENNYLIHTVWSIWSKSVVIDQTIKGSVNLKARREQMKKLNKNASDSDDSDDSDDSEGNSKNLYFNPEIGLCTIPA